MITDSFCTIIEGIPRYSNPTTLPEFSKTSSIIIQKVITGCKSGGECPDKPLHDFYLYPPWSMMYLCCISSFPSWHSFKRCFCPAGIATQVILGFRSQLIDASDPIRHFFTGILLRYCRDEVRGLTNPNSTWTKAFVKEGGAHLALDSPLLDVRNIR